MPNRILRDGILTSDRVNSLSIPAEVFYRRLMSVVDDYGRFDARPTILRVSCFPLRVNEVREADISRWMAECQKAGLIALYAVGGKTYLEMCDFRQQVRSVRSRYPERPAEACVADAQHMHSTCVAHAHLDGDVVEDDIRRRRRETGPPAGVRPEVWDAWVKYRGKKLTEQAIVLQTKRLEEWSSQGHDPNEIIETSIANTWAGLFPPYSKKRGQTLQERRAANMATLCGDGDDRGDGRAIVLPPADYLREPDGDDVGRGRPLGAAENVGG